MGEQGAQEMDNQLHKSPCERFDIRWTFSFQWAANLSERVGLNCPRGANVMCPV